MTNKKGFFNFFKGISKPEYHDEDEKQRAYAKSMAQAESGDTWEPASQPSIQPDPVVDTPIEEPEEDRGPVPDEIVTHCQDRLSELLRLSGMPSDINIAKNTNQCLVLEIINESDAGRIIGKEGSTLDAFQTLLRSSVYKKFDTFFQLILDAGDYRKRRQESLRSITTKATEAVLQKKGKVELKPMNASERRLVHMQIKKERRVRSFSVGNGSSRRVVLDLDNGNSR